MQNQPTLTDEEQSNIDEVNQALSMHYSWLRSCAIAAVVGVCIIKVMAGAVFGIAEFAMGATLGIGAYCGWATMDRAHGATGITFYGPLALWAICMKFAFCVPIGLFRFAGTFVHAVHDIMVGKKYLRSLRSKLN